MVSSHVKKREQGGNEWVAVSIQLSGILFASFWTECWPFIITKETTNVWDTFWWIRNQIVLKTRKNDSHHWNSKLYHLMDRSKLSMRADRQNASYVCIPSDSFTPTWILPSAKQIASFHPLTRFWFQCIEKASDSSLEWAKTSTEPFSWTRHPWLPKASSSWCCSCHLPPWIQWRGNGSVYPTAYRDERRSEFLPKNVPRWIETRCRRVDHHFDRWPNSALCYRKKHSSPNNNHSNETKNVPLLGIRSGEVQFHNFFLTIHLDIHKSSLQIDRCKFLHSCKVSLHSHLRLALVLMLVVSDFSCRRHNNKRWDPWQRRLRSKGKSW